MGRYNRMSPSDRSDFQDLVLAGGDDVVEATTEVDGRVVDAVQSSGATVTERALALRAAAQADDTEAVEDLLRGGDATAVRLTARTDPERYTFGRPTMLETSSRRSVSSGATSIVTSLVTCSQGIVSAADSWRRTSGRYQDTGPVSGRRSSR
jgi:hypothetical protein